MQFPSWLAGLVFLFAPTASASAQQPFDAARLARTAAGDSVFWAQASDLDGLRVVAEKNAWYKLARDPGFTATFSWMQEQIAEEDKDTIEPFAMFDAVHGGAALFVTPPKAGTHTDIGSVGLLVVVGPKREAFDAQMAKIVASWAKESTESAATYQDVAIRLFSPPAAATGTPAGDASASPDHDGSPAWGALLRCDGLDAVVASNSREEVLAAAGAIVDRWRGKSPDAGMAASTLLAEARKATGRSGRLEFLVDLGAVIRIAKEEHEAPSEAEETKIMSALGVDELRWVHGSADIGEGESLDVDLAMNLPQKGALATWATFLKPPTREFVHGFPRSSSSVQVACIDIWGLWQSVWSTMNQIHPEETKAARTQLEQVSQAAGGVDPESDFVSQLTGEFGEFTCPIPFDEWKAVDGAAITAAGGGEELEKKLAALPHLGSAYVIGLKDSEAVAGFLEAVLGMFGMAEATDNETVDGDEIVRLQLQEGQTLSWCFQPKRLVISTYPSAMTAALAQGKKADSPSVLDDPRFKPHFEAHKDAWMLGMSNTSQSLELAVGALGLLSMMDGSSEETPPMPSPEIFAKYLKGTLIGSSTRTAGMIRLTLAAR